MPSSAIYNQSDRRLKRQVTIKLHALSDPKALKHVGAAAGAYIDAQLPAKIRIEDRAPTKGRVTIPPTCTGTGYGCATSKYYTVEYRQGYGFDRSLPRVVSGQLGLVVVHLYAPDAKNQNGNISYLVNVYPGKKTSSGGPVTVPHSGGLQPGDDYADPAHNAYVAVNSFDGSSRTATVTLGGAKLAPQLRYTGDRKGASGQAVTLSARLTVDGAPVPSQPLRFTLAGQGCGPALTDPTGRASCQITDTLTPIQTAAGSAIKASFPGDSVYKSVTASATFGGGLAIVTPVPPLPAITSPAATVVAVTAS
jgi:hypothetical protein